jgi:hypothetical protein
LDTPKLNKHLYGASLGGPIVKNRFFLFGNYERLEESSEDPALRDVPSASFRDGVMMYECGNPALCPGGTVQGLTASHSVPAGFFGLTPAQFAAIDPLGIGPNLAAVAHFGTYPLPNEPGSDQVNLAGFRFTSPIENTLNTYIVRADLNIDTSGNHILFWRGNLQDDVLGGTQQFPGQPPSTSRLVANRGMALGYNAVISPTVVNTFRYGFTRIKDIEQGLQSSSAVNFLGLSDNPALTKTSQRRAPSHNLRDDLTITRSSHTFQTGVNMRWTRIPRSSNANSFHNVRVDNFWIPLIGREFMPGQATCTTAGCSAVPAVSSNFQGSWATGSINLWALPTRGQARYNFNSQGDLLPVGADIARRFAADEYEFYIQDTWRVRPTLTVSYGVRYSLYSPPWETNGQQVAPFPGFNDLFERRKAGQAQGIPSNVHPRVTFDLSGPANDREHFYPWDYNNWAPRISAAWSPRFTGGVLGGLFGDQKSVFRGGYSIVYDRIGLALARSYDTSGVAFGMSAIVGNPFGSIVITTPQRFTSVSSVAGLPAIPPAPPGGFPATPPFGIELLVSGMIDDGNTTPYAHTYNVTFERQLPGDFSVEVGYVGRSGRNNLLKREFNQIMGDFVDPDSGMTFWEAATMLVEMIEEGDPRGFSSAGYDFIAGHRPTSQVPPIPFWENVFPGAAGNTFFTAIATCDIDGMGAAKSATQAVYDAYLCLAPSWGDISLLMDFEAFCVPDGTCSRFGSYFISLDQWCCLAGQSTVGWSEYHSLQLSVRKRYSHGTQFDFNYTLSKSLDVASHVERGGGTGDFRAGGTTFVQESFNLGKQYSFSDFDIRHQFNTNVLADLPFGHGKPFGTAAPGWLNQIIGGWQVSGLFRLTSGFPFNVTGCSSCFPTGPFNVGNADIALGMGLPETKTTRNAVDGRPSAFPDANEALTHLRVSHPGSIGFRNLLRGDGYFVIDTGLGKSFNLPIEGHQFRFRWETFNITNTPKFNVGGFSGRAGIPSFGRYNSTYAACDGRAGRCMQFSLRYEF